MKVKHTTDVPIELYKDAPGVTIQWLWSEADGAPNFALRLIEVQVGAATPYHTHPYEHEIFILNGQARLRGEGQEYPLSPGDTALVLPNEKHQIINIGSETLRLLCAIPTAKPSN